MDQDQSTATDGPNYLIKKTTYPLTLTGASKFSQMLLRFATVATACLLLGTTPVHSVGLGTPSERAKARLECFEYLKAYLPPRDINLTDAWLYRNVDMALLTRTQPDWPWISQVPWGMFLNDVLPYARYDRLNASK